MQGLLELKGVTVVFVTSGVEVESFREGPFLSLLVIFKDKLCFVTSENEALGFMGIKEDWEGGMVIEEEGRKDERDGLGITIEC